MKFVDSNLFFFSWSSPIALSLKRYSQSLYVRIASWQFQLNSLLFTLIVILLQPQVFFLCCESNAILFMSAWKYDVTGKWSESYQFGFEWFTIIKSIVIIIIKLCNLNETFAINNYAENSMKFSVILMIGTIVNEFGWQ